MTPFSAVLNYQMLGESHRSHCISLNAGVVFPKSLNHPSYSPLVILVSRRAERAIFLQRMTLHEGVALLIVITFVRSITLSTMRSAAVLAPFFKYPLITGDFSCHFCSYRNCFFYHFRPRWFPKRIPKTSAFISSMRFSTETRWARYDHIFTLRMNTCFFYLFHNWFYYWYATNTLTTSAEITMTILVVWSITLFISKNVTDSNQENKEYYSLHDDS